MNYPLAVVIPTWKPDFFEQVLDAFANQTSRNFRIYVGDDACCWNVDAVVERYRDRLDILYHRFDSNLGGWDLVAHWERCIALTDSEPLIWLFSDDDLVSPECVESLLNAYSENPDVDVFHFDVAVIDACGRVVERPVPFPVRLSAVEFYRMRRDGQILSFAPEFVMTRRAQNASGFVKFDLAWGADLCTWIKFATRHEILTMDAGEVSWRRSGVNISTSNADFAILERKLMSEILNLLWIRTWFSDGSIRWLWSDTWRAARSFSRGSISRFRPWQVRMILMWGWRYAVALGGKYLVPLLVIMAFVSSLRRFMREVM